MAGQAVLYAALGIETNDSTEEKNKINSK